MTSLTGVNVIQVRVWGKGLIGNYTDVRFPVLSKYVLVYYDSTHRY